MGQMDELLLVFLLLLWVGRGGVPPSSRGYSFQIAIDSTLTICLQDLN